ncbi:MAG: hypothetical protein AAF483_23085 [Planctomycetota bacterium]
MKTLFKLTCCILLFLCGQTYAVAVQTGVRAAIARGAGLQVVLKQPKSSWEESFETIRKFDVNQDGTEDLELQSYTYRGPNFKPVTYLRMITLEQTYILKAGKPMKDGDKIGVADLLKPSRSVGICTIGSPMSEPGAESVYPSSRLWSDMDCIAFALCIKTKAKLQLGYVLLTVKKDGTIRLGETHLEEIGCAPVTIQIPNPNSKTS